MIHLAGLKKIIGKKAIAHIKLILAYPQYSKILMSLNKGRNCSAVFLIGTPIHDNLGDHLIAESEMNFLKSYFSAYKLFEIPMEMFFLYSGIIRKNIHEGDIVFISGGGWMGNLWEHDEIMMQNIVSSFKNNKIFIFPQTIYYDKKMDNYSDVVSKARTCYGACSNLTISLRDVKSYETARQELKLPAENICLLPDMGLMFQGIHIEQHNKKYIALCMRKDCEKNISDISTKKIEETLRTHNIEFTYTDTLIKGFLPIYYRKRKLQKKFKEFAGYSLIITDRLHAVIFSALVNTPCIAVNNITGKVYGVYSLWLQNKSKVIYVKSIKELEETVINSENSFLKLPDYDGKEYYHMLQNIKEKIGNENGR